MCKFCCAARPCYLVKDPTTEKLDCPVGYYNHTLFCPSCTSRSCRSCVLLFADTDEVQCPNKECRAPLVDLVEYADDARVHTFRHEVIDGDFSHETQPTLTAMQAVIARYVLRGHLYIAGEYTRRYILKNHLQSQIITILDGIVTRALGYLQQYNLTTTNNQYKQDVREFESIMPLLMVANLPTWWSFGV